jgi:TPR repeat protein
VKIAPILVVVVVVVVFLGAIAVKLTAPAAEVQSGSSRSVGVDVSRSHQNAKNFSFIGGATSSWPPTAQAKSIDQGSTSYSLADALIPYAKLDYARALKLLAPLAERGDAVAQLKIGIIFFRGKVGSPDHNAAIRWFTKAAENGQAEAEFQLGQIYRGRPGSKR